MPTSESIDHLVKGLRQRARLDRELDSQSGDDLKARRRRGCLGLSIEDLGCLQLHVRRSFFKNSGDDHDWIFVDPGPQPWSVATAERVGVHFGICCDSAISDACGDFADLLCQAVITRHKSGLTQRLVDELWKEALRFATELAKWECAVVWVNRVWLRNPRFGPNLSGPDLQRIATPRTPAPPSFGEGQRAFKEKFVERLQLSRSVWLSAAANRISLRSILSERAPIRAVAQSAARRAAVGLFLRFPAISFRRACNLLDKADEEAPGSAPTPPTWRSVAPGCRGWSQAYDDRSLKNRVKVFLSKTRGIAKSLLK